MKTINLGGKSFKKAIVDDEDYERLNKYSWHEMRCKTVTYAATNVDGKDVYMHHFILPPKEGYIVDHKHHDGLDNRKGELRYATNSQSGANTRRICKTKSGYKGVNWYTRTKKWQARIKIYGITKSLGYHVSKEEAALAYNRAALRYFGEFAHLNDVNSAKP